jgi:hypothetical protein
MSQLEVTIEDGAKSGGNRRNLKINLPQWHFLHHCPRIKSPEIKAEALGCQA